MAEPNSSSDLTTTDAAEVTRAVESNVADIVALRGRGSGSSFEREMEALPFIGELSRDCIQCKGYGVVRLSEEKQELWKAKLAELRLDLARVPSDKQSDDVREKAAKALSGGITDYQKACRCPACEGLGRTVAPGVTRQRVPCEACVGVGRDPEGETCRTCLGSTFASLGVPDSCWNTVSCWRCKGSGEVPDEDTQDVCPVCSGDKYTQPITVRETGCSKKGGGLPSAGEVGGSSAGMLGVPDGFAVTWDDEDAVAEKARGIEFLAALREVDARAARTLDAYYGPDGDHYAKTTTWGRGHALWPDTEGGKALLREASENGGYVRPLAALAAMRAAESASPVKNIPRQAHMRAAVSESRQLIESARAALVEVAGL